MCKPKAESRCLKKHAIIDTGSGNYVHTDNLHIMVCKKGKGGRVKGGNSAPM